MTQSTALLPFQYQVKRSKRKTIGLYIKDANVEVRAPHFVPQQEIDQWVEEKSDWVVKQLNLQYQQALEKPDISQGGKLLFLGEEKNIELIQGAPAIYEKDKTLIIARQARTNIHKLIQGWIRTEAELYLIDRTHELAEVMALSASLKGVAFRKTRSKWGHCTSKGIIQYNWLVIMAPPDVIDYLIIHELSHLVYMNHSKQFWLHVEKFCPKYKQLKKWLNDNGHRLSL